MAFRVASVVVVVVVFLVVISLVTGVFGVEGNERSISNEEDLELERQLRILNKPAIKSIESDYGGIYDCVDIYKQPALDHPLLKGHKIQMRPSASFWRKNKNEASLLHKPQQDHEALGVKTIKIGLNDGCPSGTVPIKRTKKEDLIRAKSVLNRNRPDLYPSKAGYGYEFAGIQTKSDNGRKYYGAGAYLNIHNPKAKHLQSSGATILIEGGPQDQLNKIHVGWRVDPDLYGDDRTRLSTFWTADSHRSTGCFDTLCPGFVQLDSNIPLGYVFQNISVDRGRQYYVKLLVSQDKASGNWLLHTIEHHTIGHWPKGIFTSFTNNGGADMVRWAGQVYSGTKDRTPPMGSGLFKNKVYRRTAWFAQVIFDYTSKGLYDVDDNSIYIMESSCYFVGDNSYKTEDNLGYSFLYGGKGGTFYSCPHDI